MKSFKERDPIRVGLVGTVVLLLALLAVFNFDSIPGISSSRTITAEFADASGIAGGDTVQIGGVDVGKVTRIDLESDHVDVVLSVDSQGRQLGERTSAAIKVETALGRRYVELTPDGNGEVGDRIPLGRTRSGFDITDSLSKVTERLEGTDKATVSEALTSVSTLMEELPTDLKVSADGIAEMARTVASRDQEIADLLANANGVTGVLGEHNQELTTLIADGETLFAALDARADTIRSVMIEVRRVSDQIRGLAADNRESTPPMLTELDRVLATLNSNYENIDNAITGMRPFVTQLGEVVGSGPFFGVLLQNIAPANLNGQIPGSPGGVN